MNIINYLKLKIISIFNTKKKIEEGQNIIIKPKKKWIENIYEKQKEEDRKIEEFLQKDFETVNDEEIDIDAENEINECIDILNRRIDEIINKLEELKHTL